MPGGQLFRLFNPASIGSIAGIFTFALKLNTAGQGTIAMEELTGIRDETTLPEETKQQIEGAGTVDDRVDRITQYQRHQIFSVLGELARTSIIPNLVRVTPTYTGRLQFSTNYVLGSEKISQDEEVVRLVVYQNAHRDKFFYRPIMEEGRTPGARMPPVQNIEDWARTKVSGISINNPKKLRRHAFAIARNIGVKGIVPRNYTTRAIVMSSQAIADASARIGGAITIMESGPGFRQTGADITNVVQVFERNVRGQFAPTQPTHRRAR